MAKIVHSEAAPAEAVHYSFAGVEFDLGGRSKSFESDDPVVLSNAASHPWLTVEYPKVDPVVGAFREQIAPENDPFTYQGQVVNPNDPDAARAAEEAKAQGESQPVAIQSGLDQTDKVEVAGVAQTLASDDTSKTSKKDS